MRKNKQLAKIATAKKITKKAASEMVRNDYTMMYRPMPAEIKAAFPVISMEVSEEFGLHFTTDHNGKMKGMKSLSTTCKCGNCPGKIAAALKALGIEPTRDPKEAKKAFLNYVKEHPLATNISICGGCYSDSQQDNQSSMQIPLKRNYKILNNGIIHKDWIPFINAYYFRGEAFGDFNSENEVINMFNIVKKNKHLKFTAWTKNIWYFKIAIANGHKKPSNFKLVYSSQFINVQVKIQEWMRGLVDAIFTVYTKEYAEKHGIVINCGARACLACLRCYRNFKPGEIKIINEEFKFRG